MGGKKAPASSPPALMPKQWGHKLVDTAPVDIAHPGTTLDTSALHCGQVRSSCNRAVHLHTGDKSTTLATKLWWAETCEERKNMGQM